MPSLSLIRKMNRASSVGEAHKLHSEKTMEMTWDRDIATRDMYFYDWYRDTNKNQLDNMNPVKDVNKVLMRCKFIVSSSKTYSKDAVTYHLQLKPSQGDVVPYYKELFADRYSAHFPCGLYCDIQDSQNNYNRWLVVGEANYNNPQFPTYELLRCDFVVQYMFEGKKYNVPAVLRSQNSYNSGIWSDNKFTTVEDQQQFIVPLNRDTEHLFYNQRIIIDNKVLTEPRTWKVTKINRVGNNGLCLITLAQDHFDANKDFVEFDDCGNIIGMWADYYNVINTPSSNIEQSSNSSIHSSISYTGTKPVIKIGGNYKTFTVTFYEEDEVIPYSTGRWRFYIDGKDVSDIVLTSDVGVDKNQIKVKLNCDDSYIGQILTIKHVSDFYDVASVDMSIVNL